MNVYDILSEAATKYPDRRALMIRRDTGEYETFTYSAALAEAKLYSERLKEAGVRAGDRVALLAGNSPQWAIAFFAVTHIGACAVALDCALPSATHAELLAEADVRAVLCSEAYIAAARGIALPVLDLLNGLAPFDGCAARVPDDYPATPDPDPEAAAIVFSSGTTSGYKGVVHTHEGLCWAADAGGRGNELLDGERLLATIPLSHLYGLIAKLLAPLTLGATVCYIESNNAKSLLAAFEGFKPTGFCCVPRIFDMFRGKAMEAIDKKGAAASRCLRGAMKVSGVLYRRLDIKIGRVVFKQILGYFGGSCVRFMSGGAPLTPQTEGFFFDMATPLFNNYAVSETGLPLVANRPSHCHPGTCGIPIEGVKMRIHEPDARGIGEIRIKSPGMMKGYFRNPQATADAFDADGWFLTGDTGRLNRSGDLIVVGRLKENIILSTGVALSPSDIERLYGDIQGAQQLVVCGIPASVGSYDEIHAFVLPADASDGSKRAIEAAIRRAGESIPSNMRISQIHFVSSMPRTTLEKPRRFLLREQLLSSAPSEEADAPMPAIAEPVVNAIRAMSFTDKPIRPDTRVVEDLGLDSLTLTDLCLRLEELTGKDISTSLRPHITVLDIAEALEAAQKSEPTLYAGRYRLDEFPKKRRVSDRLTFAAIEALFKTAWRFDVQRLENLPESGNYLLCPNHQTDLDAIYIQMCLPRKIRGRLCAMGAIEHLDTPFRRHLMYMSGAIPVDRRGNPAPAFTRCREVLEDGRILLVHPEGTRTRTGEIGEFKKGAARLAIQTGRSIVPVRIKGAYELFPYTSKIPKLTGRPTVSICFGKPISPADTDAETLTEAVRRAMLAL